jgi:hypothetical protein
MFRELEDIWPADSGGSQKQDILSVFCMLNEFFCILPACVEVCYMGLRKFELLLAQHSLPADPFGRTRSFHVVL